jgi:hypothetical protein
MFFEYQYYKDLDAVWAKALYTIGYVVFIGFKGNHNGILQIHYDRTET